MDDEPFLRALGAIFLLIRKVHLFGVMDGYAQIDEFVRLRLVEPEGAEILRLHFGRFLDALRRPIG